MNEDLIDRIYECAVVPELWPAVLDALADITQARGGLLFSANRALHWTASGSIRDVFEAYVRDGWFLRCPRRPCLMGRSQPSFFVERDFWSDDEIATEPIYRDFFRPRGLGWSAGTGLQVPTGDAIVFSMERAFDRGPFEPEQVERLNALRPHLARSALVSARLGLGRAQGATEALAALRLPALLLDEAGAVVETNAEVDALPATMRQGTGGRLVLADAAAQDMLAGALRAIAGSAEGGRCTFPLRDELGRLSLVLHLIPVRRSAHDIFGRSFALLMMTPIGSGRAPSSGLLRSLFDLTPSEARVAQGIATGQTPEQIAQAGAVAITTIRSQLRRVLEKTGCARQAELAALLASVALRPD